MFSNDNLEVLANYESVQLVKLQFAAKHNRKVNTGKAREIATAFTQARSYLSSASTASRDVKPLLVYYAVLSFSRALTMFLSPNLREAGLAPAHGLSATGWTALLDQDGGDVGDLKVGIKSNGTLIQLIEATNHESYLRSNSSAPNHIKTHASPTPDVKIGLDELFARIPDIRPTYVRWKLERSAVSVSVQRKMNDGRVSLRVNYPYTTEDFEAVFGSGFEVIEQDGSQGFLIPSDHEVGSMTDATGTWNIGHLVALNRYACGIELSKIATTFVLSYILGMLVRYYPSHWVGILQNHRYDAAMPTLLAGLQHVETEYPRMVVDFLERRPAPK